MISRFTATNEDGDELGSSITSVLHGGLLELSCMRPRSFRCSRSTTPTCTFQALRLQHASALRCTWPCQLGLQCPALSDAIVICGSQDGVWPSVSIGFGRDKASTHYRPSHMLDVSVSPISAPATPLRKTSRRLLSKQRSDQRFSCDSSEWPGPGLSVGNRYTFAHGAHMLHFTHTSITGLERQCHGCLRTGIYKGAGCAP